jgi:hypothetical protein
MLRSTIPTILFVVVILAGTLVVSLAATLGIVGVAWVTIQVFPALSLFQASVIALVIGAAALLVAYRILSAATSAVPMEDLEDEYEDEVEEPEPPVVPWRRSRPAGEAGPPPEKPGISRRKKMRR